jgi:DNA polymerase bacteriophage-type
LDTLHIDFETRSEVGLSNKDEDSVGLYNYSVHPSTRALMLAWALNDEKISLWGILRGQPMPAILKEAFENPAVMIAAWNSPFERHVLKYVLGIGIPIERWTDPQASARYLSLPADLDTAGVALGLPPELRKDDAGERLIKIFSKLTIPRKKRAKKGEVCVPPRPYFRDHNSDPILWDDFEQYCIQDVEAEREIMRRLVKFQVYPLPEREQAIWRLDQKINDVGMPTDIKFVRNAYTIGKMSSDRAVEKLKAITGLENPKSPTQFLEWAQPRGYKPNTLKKEYVEFALGDKENPMSDELRNALEIRKTAAATSYSKLETIAEHMCADGQLRNQFIFMGSARAGRWSSASAQLHNMARPTPEFEEEENLDAAREMIYNLDYDGLAAKFGEANVMSAVKSSIRSSFVATPGNRFDVADLNAIETRVAAWLADCGPLLHGFRNIPDFDPYLEFASKMTGIPYQDLFDAIHGTDKQKKAVAKRHRQIAKPGVLGCVYRLSGGGWGKNKYGDPIKVGLWGYAENMGVKMDLDTALQVVKMFREVYPEIGQLWYKLEEVVYAVLRGPKNAKGAIGPNGCVKIDKINRKGKHPVLRIQLPSGRYLHYIDAHLEDIKMPWTKSVVKVDENGKQFVAQETVWKPGLVYSGVDQQTHQWTPHIVSHGGKLTENIVQAIARDVLAEMLLRADAAGFCITGHVHDELVTQQGKSLLALSYKVLEQLMAEPVSWAPDLPLGAAGYSGPYYHK